ncbi:hypothetical protein AVEN_228927-1 [Araneus ventricosus]|uniref:Uncharacterized protein n=1 Tax=Araneus ventricosus TaxID=182803 RepID=A0A4Y2HAY3_ARAVE|nr:hypothetical protein AVEN_228927-1 [Araneus ventricosus]
MTGLSLRGVPLSRKELAAAIQSFVTASGARIKMRMNRESSSSTHDATEIPPGSTVDKTQSAKEAEGRSANPSDEHPTPEEGQPKLWNQGLRKSK